MKALKPLYAALALLAVCAALPAYAEGTFVPPKEKIEKPYTNDKCLKNCHGEKTLYAGNPDGSRRHLYVDLDSFFESTHGQKGLWCIDCHQGSDPNEHPRTGYAKVTCRACHSEKPPEGAFPPNAAEILKARNVVPPSKKDLKGDSWVNSAHGKAFDKGVPNAPACPGCHTAHYVRKASDPKSTVYVCNLPATCGRCHQGQAKSYDPGGWLARFAIAGHGKGDFSNVYSVSRCLSCHQGQAAHGEDTVTGQACPACHRPEEKLAEGKKDFHIDVSGDNEGGLAMRVLYDVLVYGGALFAIVAVLFWGVTTIYRKEE